MDTSTEKKFDNWQFKRLRKLLNLNQTEFAAVVGSSQQTIAMIENNTRGIPASIREGFYKKYGVSYEKARECETPEELSVLLNKQIILNTKSNIIPVPFYSAKASAGKGEMLPDYPEEKVIYFDRRFLQNIIGVNPEHAAIIQAKGDSMDGGNKPIKDGDLLIIDDSVKEIINDRIFVIQLNTDLLVKRVIKEWDGTVRLISNNPKYEDRILKENETAEIKGEVVWNSSKENV